jgi:hypothetical protein
LLERFFTRPPKQEVGLFFRKRQLWIMEKL